MFKRLFKKIFAIIVFLCMPVVCMGQMVAITQITSHKALDDVRRGTEDALRELGYVGKIDFANAQGEIATAVQIAKRFVSKQADVIVAIATPSAQAAVKAANGGIPVVFATVTDPVSAKLVDSLNNPGKNVTGTRNKSPIGKQLDLIREVMPGVKRIGIPLNFAEMNSVDLLKEAKAYGETRGIEIVAGPVDSSADIKGATLKLCSKVDAIFLLLDNTVASGLPSLIQTARAHKVPVFSSYIDAVEQGAVMGLAYDEYEIGRQTGAMVYRILKGEAVGSMDVEDPKKVVFAVNRGALEANGIEINPELEKRVSQEF